MPPPPDLSGVAASQMKMVCLVCHRVERSSLCQQCQLSMRPASDRLLPGGIRLIPAFEHTGAARELVHHLKYRGIVDYADLVAAVIAPRVLPLPLVPIPRAWSRRLRYGIDPARLLANRLSALTSAPVLPLLEPRLHTQRRAGGDHHRTVGPFRLRGPAPASLLLVDDVVTTGATVEAAVQALGHSRVMAVIAANAVQG